MKCQRLMHHTVSTAICDGQNIFLAVCISKCIEAIHSLAFMQVLIVPKQLLYYYSWMCSWTRLPVVPVRRFHTRRQQLPGCVLGLIVFLHSSSHLISVLALWFREYMAPTSPFCLERSVACIAIPRVLMSVVHVADLGLHIIL